MIEYTMRLPGCSLTVQKTPRVGSVAVPFGQFERSSGPIGSVWLPVICKVLVVSVTFAVVCSVPAEFSP